MLPRAWSELIGEGHELLIDTLVDKAEALSGYAPSGADALAFLQTLGSKAGAVAQVSRAKPAGTRVPPCPTNAQPAQPAQLSRAAGDRSVTYRLFGEEQIARNASVALVDILRVVSKDRPDQLAEVSEAVRTSKLNHIARSPQEINPGRPDLARAAEIAPGWLVGLNIANRDKIMIIRAACRIYGLTLPGDLEITLPNA